MGPPFPVIPNRPGGRTPVVGGRSPNRTKTLAVIVTKAKRGPGATLRLGDRDEVAEGILFRFLGAFGGRSLRSPEHPSALGAIA
jgi:hypothetical protein